MATTFAKTMDIVFLCFFMILALSAGLNPKAIAAETIKIAMVEPFSGPYNPTTKLRLYLS